MEKLLNILLFIVLFWNEQQKRNYFQLFMTLLLIDKDIIDIKYEFTFHKTTKRKKLNNS